VNGAYGFQKLIENMPCSLTELARRSGIAEPIILRMRDGKPVQRKTVKKVLYTLSELYGEQLTLDNVDGIDLGQGLKTKKV
jgi:predicted transcriptional regulator